MSGKQRNLRKRRALDEQEELPDGPDGAEGEGGAPRLTAEDIRLLQKQRQRHGVRGGCRAAGWCLVVCRRQCLSSRSGLWLPCGAIHPPAQGQQPRCSPPHACDFKPLPCPPPIAPPACQQGVEASTLAVADTRAERKAAAAAAAGSRQQDVLQAAFKRERRLHSEEEDPHM